MSPSTLEDEPPVSVYMCCVPDTSALPCRVMPVVARLATRAGSENVRLSVAVFMSRSYSISWGRIVSFARVPTRTPGVASAVATIWLPDVSRTRVSVTLMKHDALRT